MVTKTGTPESSQINVTNFTARDIIISIQHRHYWAMSTESHNFFLMLSDHG